MQLNNKHVNVVSKLWNFCEKSLLQAFKSFVNPIATNLANYLFDKLEQEGFNLFHIQAWYRVKLSIWYIYLYLVWFSHNPCDQLLVATTCKAIKTLDKRPSTPHNINQWWGTAYNVVQRSHDINKKRLWELGENYKT